MPNIEPLGVLGLDLMDQLESADRASLGEVSEVLRQPFHKRR
jgi:hypothetical protein